MLVLDAGECRLDELDLRLGFDVGLVVGQETQVPFRPTSGKPVYCSDCFQNHR